MLRKDSNMQNTDSSDTEIKTTEQKAKRNASSYGTTRLLTGCVHALAKLLRWVSHSFI